MRILQSFIVAFLILITFDVAHACSCLETGSACDHYGEATAVFLGRVVGSAQQKTHVDQNGNKTTYDVGTIRFLVQENYKGAPGYEVEIHSGTGGGDCGYWFLRNESYVVYAYKRSDDTKLYTNICTRTAHVSDATQDLEYLRGLAKAKPGATLYGALTRIIGDPEHGPYKEGPKLAGVKIVVTGEGKTVETVTDRDGQYRLTGLPPGNYDAFPELPDNLGAASNRDQQDDFGRFTGRRPVTLVERACSELSFMVQFNGIVSGKIVDAAGEPAKEVTVNLLAGDSDKRYWTTWTDKEGYYEFTRVQPGSYLLGFNLIWAPDKNDPYAKTFYPGVKTRSEASLITVGEGEKAKGYDITLPPRLSERELKVAVVWPDGKPAVGVRVNFEMNYASSLGDKVQTDAKGEATLTLFDSHHYIIYAAGITSDVYAEPIAVFVDKSLQPLRFVLSKQGTGYSAADALKRKSPN